MSLVFRQRPYLFRFQSPEPLRHDIRFGRLFAACVRLVMADLGKVLFHIRQQHAFRAALKYLGDKYPARRQHRFRKRVRRLDQPDGAQVVCLLMPGRIGRHIAHHHMRAFAAQKQQ